MGQNKGVNSQDSYKNPVIVLSAYIEQPMTRKF